jgi:hypothetical protein
MDHPQDVAADVVEPSASVGAGGPGGRRDTAELLRLLYRYLAGNAATRTHLLPAIVALRQAAQLYARNDDRAALQKGLGVYQFLVQVRAQDPALPLP